MNSIRWIVASMLVGLLATACGESTPPSEPEAERLGDVQQPLPSSYIFTTYYHEAAKINEVGWCVSPSICSGANTQCSGVKTVYKTAETQTCN